MTVLQQLNAGSRESPLALCQTEMVIAALKQRWGDLEIDLKTFKTKGDLFLDAKLSEIGDKGLFVKELEDALLKNEIDFAIHSLKDMLSVLPEGLTTQSVLEREDPRDALLSLSGTSFGDLPPGAVIGTASMRRVAQLKKWRPDLRYEVIRGNLQTRYRKLVDKQFDAIILAAAGVHRMATTNPEWANVITQYFDPQTELIPAAGQGILAVEFRANDTKARTALSMVCDPRTEAAMMAERAFLKTLEGGCQVPMGAYAAFNKTSQLFNMQGIVLSESGEQSVQATVSFNLSEASEAGKTLAEQLLADGAKAILNR
jgi:hydroxymethylbilane synthase